MSRLPAAAVPFALFLALALPAQVPDGLRGCLVADSTGDALWRLVDLNCDGDYNDPGETRLFFDPALDPSNPLDNVVGVAIGPDGAAYVPSINNDRIWRLVDLDGDGDAQDPGEISAAFDGAGGNLSGVTLYSANNIAFDAQGSLLIAHANAGAGGTDAILKLTDLNGDHDFDDAGEAVVFYAPPSTSNVGDSLPADVKQGKDGAIYYLEGGSTGFNAKGVYRLDDVNANGVIDAGEAQPYFLPTPPAGATNQFFWGLSQGPDGTWYMADTLNERIYAFRDSDGSGAIDPLTESTVVWTAIGGSNIWMVEAQADGSLYLVEDDAADRVMRLVDLNGDGIFANPAETVELMSDLISPLSPAKPRGLATFDPPPAYAGNGSDLAIGIAVGGIPSQASTNVHCFGAGSFLRIEAISPGGTRNGAACLLVAQLFATYSAPSPLALLPGTVPCVYLDLGQPIHVVLDGFSPPNPFFFPVVGAAAISTGTSPLLAGQSIMLELFCSDPGANPIALGNAPSAELRLF